MQYKVTMIDMWVLIKMIDALGIERSGAALNTVDQAISSQLEPVPPPLHSCPHAPSALGQPPPNEHGP